MICNSGIDCSHIQPVRNRAVLHIEAPLLGAPYFFSLLYFLWNIYSNTILFAHKHTLVRFCLPQECMLHEDGFLCVYKESLAHSWILVGWKTVLLGVLMCHPLGDTQKEFEYTELEHGREANAWVTALQFLGMQRSDGVAGIMRSQGSPAKLLNGSVCGGKAWLGSEPESSEDSGKNHASETKARNFFFFL